MAVSERAKGSLVSKSLSLALPALLSRPRPLGLSIPSGTFSGAGLEVIHLDNGVDTLELEGYTVTSCIGPSASASTLEFVGGSGGRTSEVRGDGGIVRRELGGAGGGPRLASRLEM